MDVGALYWYHPGDLGNLKIKAYTHGRPGSCESLIQIQKCVGFAIVWQPVGRTSIGAQMHLKIKYGHGECFFGDGKWALMTCLYFADGSSTEPFFVKKQYPPFAIFFNNYKMVAQNVTTPSHTPHLFLDLTTVFQPECNHWLL